MLTDWETWTEPVFNAVRLQKRVTLSLVSKWDTAEELRKASKIEHRLKKKLF